MIYYIELIVFIYCEFLNMIKNNRKFFVNIIDWLFYIIGYISVFIIVSFMFDSFYIDINNYFFYSIISVLILYLLNKTIKPLLFKLTIPITGVTLGLFYPILNLFVLKLTDWIMGSHFNLGGFVSSLVIATLISIMNIFVEEIIIKPILRRIKSE